jgi:hypothetical protein
LQITAVLQPQEPKPDRNSAGLPEKQPLRIKPM